MLYFLQMDYDSLARGLAIHDMPIFIEYWLEKEIHRLATYNKSLYKLKYNDSGEEIKETIKTLVSEQNARGKRYSDYLTRTSEELAGTKENCNVCFGFFS